MRAANAQLFSVERVSVSLHAQHFQRHFLDEHPLTTSQIDDQRIRMLCLQGNKGYGDRGNDEQKNPEESDEAEEADGHK